MRTDSDYGSRTAKQKKYRFAPETALRTLQLRVTVGADTQEIRDLAQVTEQTCE